MPRRTPLLAALVFALGAGGVAAASSSPASARPASATGVRVTTPCDGVGTAVLTAHKTASGGTFARTTLTGLKRHQWFGATLVTGPAHIEDDVLTALGASNDPNAEPTKPDTKYAHDGTLTESVTSRRTWPHLGASLYFSAGGDFCTALVQVRPHGIAAEGVESGLDVRPHDGIVRAAVDAEPKTRWRLTVTVWSPDGVQTATRRVRVRHYGLEERFTDFKALSTYTRVRLRAVNMKTGKVEKLTISRTL